MIVALLASIVVGCSGRSQGARESPDAAGPLIGEVAEIDHVILAIDTLERGIRLLRQATGITAVYGGAHPGRGTQNALLSLGRGRYLELLAPNPLDTVGAPRAAEFARFHALTPFGWALRTHDADELLAALRRRGLPGGAVIRGSRARPDQSILRWRTLNPWGSNRALLPFFIEWSQSSPHPSNESPSGCGLVELSMVSPAADSLRALLAQAGIAVPIRAAATEALQLVLDCPRGRVQLPFRPARAASPSSLIEETSSSA